ncbi:SurA N-terminal domain-containing protein [Spirochaetia bacterium 38H-sp]|uniref:Periplasmic chaperone PpiD n=1 Tax=Rarispira pelagica TaxID=3141764 RepID=A0ABU9UAK5_9SPIR
MANKSTAESPKQKTNHGVLYWTSIIVFTIIIVSFIGAPVVTKYYSGSYGGDVIGSYDGKEIKIGTGGYFDRQLSSLYKQYESQLNNASKESRPFLEYQLYQQAINSTAVHLAALNLAKDAGFTLSPKEIDKAIIQAYTEYGKFDEKSYNNTSALERAKLREFYRDLLTSETVINDLVQGQKVSKKEAEFIANMEYPQRKISYVAYDTSSFPESEIIKFGKENSDMFRKRELSQITLDKQQDAEKLYQEILKEPSKFEDFAKEKSVDNYAKNSGKAGALPYAQLTEYMEEKDASSVFELKTGEIAGVIKAKTGKFLIIRADSDIIEPDFEKQDTINYIKRYILNYHRDIVDKYFYTMAEELKKAGKNGFSSAAKAQNLEVKETKYFPINVGNIEILPSPKASADDTVMAAATTSEDFYRTVFTTPVGEITGPVNLRSYIIVALIEDEKQSPEDKKDAEYTKQIYQYFAMQYINRDIYSFIVDKDRLKVDTDKIAKILFNTGAGNN